MEASFRYILDPQGRQGYDENIVFLAHLGDVTKNGSPREYAAATEVFDCWTTGASYGVLAGNHDVSTAPIDQRGKTPYLALTSPAAGRQTQTPQAPTPGYNTAHIFRAGGRSLAAAVPWTGDVGQGFRLDQCRHRGEPDAAGDRHHPRDRRLSYGDGGKFFFPAASRKMAGLSGYGQNCWTV